MPLLRTGRNRIAGLITGAETCTWGTSTATIWVASSTSAHDAASTWPAGSAVVSTAESGYPLTNTNVLQYRGVYSTAQANFQWECWWIHSATASGGGVPLNWAAQQALGTKANTQSWQITTCVTVTT